MRHASRSKSLPLINRSTGWVSAESLAEGHVQKSRQGDVTIFREKGRYYVTNIPVEYDTFDVGRGGMLRNTARATIDCGGSLIRAQRCFIAYADRYSYRMEAVTLPVEAEYR